MCKMETIDTNYEMSKQVIIEVNNDNFMSEVIEASKQKPIIVDFWASWSEPCKKLTPLLENAILKYKDKLVLAKVNIDENNDIAAQLKIQSIPTVYIFFEGKIVDGVQGAQTNSEILEFIKKAANLIGPGEEVETLITMIKDVLEERKWDEGIDIAQKILEIDNENIIAFGALIRCMIGLNQFNDVKEMYEALTSDIKESKIVTEAFSSLETSEKAFKGKENIENLKNKIKKKPKDLDVILEMAVALYGNGDISDSFDLLLQSIKIDREWNNQAARKQLIDFFNTTGFEAKETILARRKLASLLFS